MPPPPQVSPPPNEAALFIPPNPIQNIAASVKNTAIFAKRLITEVADSPATVPHVCQQAENAAFLVVVAVVDFERTFPKEGENNQRVESMAKLAEELYKSVFYGTKVIYIFYMFEKTKNTILLFLFLT